MENSFGMKIIRKVPSASRRVHAPAAAKIRKFVLLYKELDADDEELTRTRKVRRSFVEERYREVITALYGESSEVPIDTMIKFQDGKTARIQTTLQVRELTTA